MHHFRFDILQYFRPFFRQFQQHNGVGVYLQCLNLHQLYLHKMKQHHLTRFLINFDPHHVDTDQLQSILALFLPIQPKDLVNDDL